MGSSLHTRLLLSYGLLIAVLLGLFSLGMLVSLLRNPLIYEHAAQELRTAQRAVIQRGILAGELSEDPASLAAAVDQAAQKTGVRVALLDSAGATLADSQPEAAARLHVPLLRLSVMAQRNEIVFLRDRDNRLWLALAQPLDAQKNLVLAVRRPRLAVVEFIRSELVRPALLSGLAGLGLALVISLILAQWISAPLKRIGAAADILAASTMGAGAAAETLAASTMGAGAAAETLAASTMGADAASPAADAAGPVLTIPLAGPAEVRRLAETFNRMVQRVQEAQQSQRDLVANVSHELKTPLTSIQGFTQAILDGVLQTPEEIHQAAQVIFDESSRMSRLVQDLVALARLESGTADLQRAPLDLTALVQGVAEKFRPQVAQAGLRLRVDMEALPWGMGDADRLAQVFSNLVDNAIKYSPPGGEIVLQARPKGSAVEVRVADSGPGVKPADRERIFQRFYQSDGARPGMGLGLAITRQIVLAHGGAIRVEPGAHGGSVFVVTLPARVETRK